MSNTPTPFLMGPALSPRTIQNEHLARTSLFPVMLVLMTMLGPLAMSSFVPALPAIQTDFAVSSSVSQLVLSLSIFLTAVGSIVYGSIADRIGRRPALLAGMALAIVGCAIAALGSTIIWVIVGRALQSLGAGAGFVLARVLVYDVYGPRRSAAVLGYVTAAMAVAPMIGPLLGGLIIDSAGWRWIFGGVGIVAAAILLLLTTKLPETRPDKHHGNASDPAAAATDSSPGWTHLLRRPGYLRYIFVGVASQTAFFAFAAGAPYVMMQQFGMSASAYGTMFILAPLGFLLGSLTAARTAHMLGNQRMARLGVYAGVLFAIIGLAWTLMAPEQYWAIFAPVAIMGFFAGWSLPGVHAGLLEAADDMPGMGSGVFSFIQLTASALIAQAASMVLGYGSSGITGLMLLATSVGLLGYLYFERAECHRIADLTK